MNSCPFALKASLLALAIMSFPTIAGAQAVEHCPAPSTILNTNGVHHAPANDARYQWVGVAAAGNSGNVLRFDEAVFYPDGETANIGELARCSYKLEKGALDLVYKDGSGRPKVQLLDANAWMSEVGPFGIVYYVCTASNAAACTFKGARR